MTNWMFQRIQGRRDTAAPLHLAFHKMQLVSRAGSLLGHKCFTDANNASLEDFETLIQLSQHVVFL